MWQYFLYFVSLFGLAQSANLVRLAEAPLEVLGFWRLLVSALLFLPFALKNNFIQNFRSAPQTLNFSLTSGFFFFTHLWTFFYASQNTTIANCMIIYSTNPLFTALGAWLFFNEKFTKRLAVAYILAFIGIYQLVSHNLDFDRGLVKGDFAALISALLFTGYLLTGKKVRHTFSNSAFSTTIYFTAAMLFLFTGLTKGIDFIHYPTQTWLAIGGSILFPTLLGHALFMYLVRYMNINMMTCGKLIEPPISAVIAFLLFGEVLKDNTLLAFILTSSAVLILFAPEIYKHSKKTFFKDLDEGAS